MKDDAFAARGETGAAVHLSLEHLGQLADGPRGKSALARLRRLAELGAQARI